MLFKFSSHTLEETEEGYIVTLYMETQDEEFANEFNNNESSLGNDMLNKSIMSYIKEHLPNIKIKLIKVMAGSVLLLTISMAALEASLQVTYASTVYTQTQIQQALENSSANIVLDGKLLDMSQGSIILKDTAYGSLREICELLEISVEWDESFSHAEITKNDIELSFKIGDSSCVLNGKNTSMPQSIIVNGKTMISLRFLSETFGFKFSWNDKLRTTVISSTNSMPQEHELELIVPKPIPNNSSEKVQDYSQEDLYWLSRLVHAESQGECYDGKLAVANVILNRVKSSEFPNDVKSVVFDKQYGVQFTPTVNGEIYSQPSKESTQAAMEALKGKNNAKGALYFLNPRKATSSWIQKNRKYAFSIENHNFYF